MSRGAARFEFRTERANVNRQHWFPRGIVFFGNDHADWQEHLAVEVRLLVAELTALTNELQPGSKKDAHANFQVHSKLDSVLREMERLKTTINSQAANGSTTNQVPLNLEAQDLVSKLTSREIQVLKLIGEGKRSKEIARLLSITAKTVVSHRSNLASKLQIHEASNLVRFAIRCGLSKM